MSGYGDPVWFFPVPVRPVTSFCCNRIPSVGLNESDDLAVNLKNTLIIIYTHIHKYMPEITSVRMRTDTKALLDDLKLNPRETYDDVVRRLAESAYDDEPLTPEEIEAMEEGIADIKAGRVRTLDEIMKELGDDKIIGSKRKSDVRNL
jgi:hypothetical protein